MIKLEQARAAIMAAEKKAKALGQPMNIAVSDEGGNLLAFIRMEGAWLGSIQIAIDKAWTARAFDIETGKLGEMAAPNEQFFGIHSTNGGRVVIFAGGVPLKVKDAVVGGIGVSGGTGEQDQAVAQAGAAALR